MTERLIDLSEDPARLHVRHGLLVIEREGHAEFTIPLEELAVLLVSHPRVSMSQAVLSGLTAAGGAFVACDEKHLPVGMLLPIAAHYVQAERFARQAAASLPTRKRLWQQIVRAKIAAQARTLSALNGTDAGLARLVPRVRSGDPANVEAQAARLYWPALFRNPDFHRNAALEDANRLLNYGYAVLRALVARTVCAAGLHPSLGLHHHNRYDAFCLADDLMEPFRPLVDAAVVRWTDRHGDDAPLDRDAKAALIAALMGRFTVDAEARTLFDLLARMAASLAAVFAGERKNMFIPPIVPTFPLPLAGEEQEA
jgi:CRISPR-associated protein Cas1